MTPKEKLMGVGTTSNTLGGQWRTLGSLGAIHVSNRFPPSGSGYGRRRREPSELPRPGVPGGALPTTAKAPPTSSTSSPPRVLAFDRSRAARSGEGCQREHATNSNCAPTTGHTGAIRCGNRSDTRVPTVSENKNKGQSWISKGLMLDSRRRDLAQRAWGRAASVTMGKAESAPCPDSRSRVACEGPCFPKCPGQTGACSGRGE